MAACNNNRTKNKHLQLTMQHIRSSEDSNSLSHCSMAWNSLPAYIRYVQTYEFMSQLEMHLFAKQDLRAGWLNTQSLSNKSIAVCETIKERCIDVLALTETWHHSSDDICLRLSTPPGYAAVDQLRPSDPDHGGIVVIYRSSLKCTRLDLPVFNSFEALCLKLSSGCTTWILLTIYRPGSRHITSQFFEELSTALETIVMYGCPVVLGGDINIHVEDSSDADNVCLLDLLSVFNMRQHVLEPTHVKGGILDLIITFDSTIVKDVYVSPAGALSDHSLLTAVLPFQRPVPRLITRRVRSWRSVDRGVLRSAIIDSSLGRQPPPSATADELFAEYDNVLRAIADQLAPERSVRCRVETACPWFDADCRALRRDCRRLERKYRRSRATEHKSAFTAAMKRKHETFELKRNQYWSGRIAEEKRCPVKLWRSVAKVLERDNVSSCSGGDSADAFDADTFIDFFEDKVKVVRACTEGLPSPAFNDAACSASLTDLAPCSIDEV